MKRITATLAILFAALLLAAPAADAKRRPSTRVRIHRLELRLNHLEAKLDQAYSDISLANERTDEVAASFSCLSFAAAYTQPIAGFNPPGASNPISVLGIDTTDSALVKAPLWIAYTTPDCLANLPGINHDPTFTTTP